MDQKTFELLQTLAADSGAADKAARKAHEAYKQAILGASKFRIGDVVRAPDGSLGEVWEISDPMPVMDKFDILEAGKRFVDQAFCIALQNPDGSFGPHRVFLGQGVWNNVQLESRRPHTAGEPLRSLHEFYDRPATPERNEDQIIADAEDALDSQTARTRLADLKVGRTKVVSGAELEARLAAMMDE